jgi:hypothetical protein
MLLSYKIVYNPSSSVNRRFEAPFDSIFNIKLLNFIIAIILKLNSRVSADVLHDPLVYHSIDVPELRFNYCISVRYYLILPLE